MRILISILLCYYLTATLGISSAVHTCGGHYAGITFWGLLGNNKCACPKNEHGKDNNCCKEKHFFCKISAEHSASVQSDLYSPILLLALAPTYFVIPTKIPSFAEKIIPHNHAPPNVRQQAIYLVCRKLLI